MLEVGVHSTSLNDEVKSREVGGGTSEFLPTSIHNTYTRGEGLDARPRLSVCEHKINGRTNVYNIRAC